MGRWSLGLGRERGDTTSFFLFDFLDWEGVRVPTGLDWTHHRGGDEMRVGQLDLGGL